jgi:hypothetical protein
LFSQKVRFHGDGALTKYLEDLGAVSLHHAMLGTSFHLRDQLADRLGMPEFPARNKPQTVATTTEFRRPRNGSLFDQR